MKKLFVLYSKVAELLSFIVDHQQTNIDLQQKQIFLEAQKFQIASYLTSGMEYLKIAVQEMWRVLEFEIFGL